MNTWPTLIVVSYHFAPSPMVGGKRFSFLTREFARMGFDVHVITKDLWDTPHGREDPSLPLHGNVHRCANPLELPFKGQGFLAKLGNSLVRRLLAPVGLEYFWARAATRKALEIAATLPRGAPGIVIATSPPHAAMIAGGRIARRLRWPLVLDYRDPWSAYDWPSWHRSRLAQWLATRIEARLVRRSAARVLNTLAMREWFEKKFPRAAHADNHVVPNGFDAVPALAQPASEGPLRIVHAGEIYGSRSLVPLLRAMARLAETQTRPLKLITYGALPPAEWRRIREAGLEALVEEKPRTPFAQLRPELQRAHVLLAVVSEHMTYSTPYKVYDYMAAGRPILGLAPPDAALHGLLAESGAGECAEPGNIDAIERALARTLSGSTSAGSARIDRFRWISLAQQYRAAIDGVSAATHEVARALSPR